MSPSFAYVLLFSVCAIGSGIAAPAFPVDEKCGPNAEFYNCGSACAPDCANPTPSKMCTLQCIIGCFCKEGYLKNAKGECVRPHECEAHPRDIPMQFPTAPICEDNEIFNPCGTACPATCANPHPSPVCTKNCVIGCFCKEGHLKNAQGVCVQSEKCGSPTANIMPIPPRVCGDNEEFRQCKGCDGTCKNPHPLCPRICIRGCACKEGHLRSENGKCIETRACSAQIQPASFMMLPPVPTCANNEIFLSCGTACPATCANPHPSPVCTKNCVIGCFCNEGYLKNAQGVCVAATHCDAPVPASQIMEAVELKSEGTCASDREFFSDCGTQLDCLTTCGTPLPFLIHGYPQVPQRCLERMCTPGCVCKQPYVRHINGQCVERKECERKNQFTQDN